MWTQDDDLTYEGNGLRKEWVQILRQIISYWDLKISETVAVFECVWNIRADVDDVSDAVSIEACQVSRILGITKEQERHHLDRKRKCAARSASAFLPALRFVVRDVRQTELRKTETKRFLLKRCWDDVISAHAQMTVPGAELRETTCESHLKHRERKTANDVFL